MEEPLYKDNQIQIKIDNGPQDHLMGIKRAEENEFDTYVPLPRGSLMHFSLTPRGKLESELENMNPMINIFLKQAGLTANDAHIAILQAYIEDERRIQKGVEEMQRAKG
ncbi:MAG: hypothetical protein PHH54_03085 [Candidatus Nanoarchaeia archaeon]|nr:hypothetical protein [Candidatus Nanoarchaeia archaeon]MDD5740945.1 hypothetical protein [Candidatus Nanoarchaeia archaeon]